MTPSSAASPQLTSLWKLGGLSPWRLLVRVLRGVVDDELFFRASGLAFDFVVALFPLIVFLLAVFGMVALRGSQFLTGLLDSVSGLLPPETAGLFDRMVGELANHSGGGKLTFGIVAGVWFASSGTSALITTLNAIFRVREARSWLKTRMIALALTLAMAVLLLSALLMVFAGGQFVDWLAARFSWSAFLVDAWKALRWPAAVVFVMISFSLVYYCGPNLENYRRRWFSPGLVFGVLLWLASSAGLRVYLHFFNTYTATYGSLGAVMILLLWIYVSGFAFLVGGEINAAIERAALN
jgi:membrane protein